MKKLLTIFLLFVSLTLQATDYYVATAANGGDDGHDGSVGSPWLTVSYACSQVAAGAHTIHIGVGTFTETAQSVKALGVNIIGAGTTTIITSAAALNPMIAANSAAGNAVNDNSSISYIKFDGNSMTARSAIYANFRSNVKIHHCTFIDFLYNGVWLDGTVNNSSTTPTNTIPTGNEVYGCTFTNCTQATGNALNGHIRIEGQSGMLVYGNTFDQTDRAAGDNANIMTGYQNDGLKIYDNVFTKPDANNGQWNFFAEFHYSNGGFELYGNTLNGAACFDYSGSIKGAYSFGGKIHDNVFTTATQPSRDTKNQYYLDLESFTYENDVYVYNNHFKNGRGAIHVNNAQISMDNIWIYYNIIEGTGNTTDSYAVGIKVESNWGGTDPIPITNLHIYNNVINAGIQSYAGILTSVWGDITNYDIQNNIITGDFTYAVRFNNDAVAPTVTNLNINNNVFYVDHTNAIYYAAGIIFTTRDDTGNYVGTDDPLFVGAADFHLQAGSECINKGLDVGLTTDYSGNRKYGTAYDIGAYEWGRRYFQFPDGTKMISTDGKFIMIEL